MNVLAVFRHVLLPQSAYLPLRCGKVRARSRKGAIDSSCSLRLFRVDLASVAG